MPDNAPYSVTFPGFFIAKVYSLITHKPSIKRVIQNHIIYSQKCSLFGLINDWKQCNTL